MLPPEMGAPRVGTQAVTLGAGRAACNGRKEGGKSVLKRGVALGSLFSVSWRGPLSS